MQSFHKETQSSAGGRPENMGLPELIQRLLKEQVLLPYQEKSGGELAPSAITK